jgi:hypothetical protein
VVLVQARVSLTAPADIPFQTIVQLWHDQTEDSMASADARRPS